MIMKPKRLNKGDTVGVIAPASPLNKDHLQKGILFLEKLGVRVKLGNHIEKKAGYLAGTDEERLEDFHSMFVDKEVKAIICARGGYGTARFAASINYELIKANPKIFWGYSDITFLHTAIHQKTGLITFHGPMLGADISNGFHPKSKKFFKQLFDPKEIIYTEKISTLETLSEGVVSGPILGGNLTLLTSTLGTSFEIDTKGKLLFIEDVNEEPRVIDRMLNQLLMAGKLDQVKGIIIGDFNDCDARNDSSFTLDEVFRHYVQMVNKPTMKGFKIGHCSPHISIPLGVVGTLNTMDKSLYIESGIE